MKNNNPEHISKIYFNELTGIRGLASLWVVLYHLKEYIKIKNSVFFSLINKGYLAVDLFFILSGFVIFLNYNNKVSINILKIRIFLIKRLARIYPLHIFILLAYLALQILTIYISPSNSISENFSLETFIANIGLYQAWGYYHLSWNIPAWSISVEWFSYIVFCFLSTLYKKTNNLILILSLMGIIFIIIGIIYNLFGCVSIGQNIQKLGVLRCLLQFIIGNMLALLTLNGFLNSLNRYNLLTLTISIFLFLLIINNFINDYYIAPLCFCMTIAYLISSNGLIVKFLKSRILVYIGEISYSIYMLHFFLRDCFKYLFMDESYLFSNKILIIYLLTLLFFSSLTYKHIETPFKKIAHTKRTNKKLKSL